MGFIQSGGKLVEIAPTWSSSVIRSSVRMYNNYNFDYATMYRTQPSVRTCVDFYARNIAQLGLHVYRRISDTDRERLIDYPLAKLLRQPLPPKYKMTEYLFLSSIVSDLGVYFNAYLLKIRIEGQMALLRIPPIYCEPVGNLVPTGYRVTVGGLYKEFPPDDIVHFRGYNPENPIAGLPYMETLRQNLAESFAMGNYREGFWRSSAKMSGLVKRPAGAPAWSDDARERWIQEFTDLYSQDDRRVGGTAVLEEGMEWQPIQFNAQESEYLGSKKLLLEECARVYNIPAPFVNILDHATFSNITEQHKNLYQDTLGPVCTSIQQDLMLQLLPEFTDTEGVYVEFNIAAKLAGSFEEQAKIFQSSVGRPYMTPNEARARLNLNALGGDADQLATPLNVIVGGQASPQDSAPPADGMTPAKGRKARRGFDSYDQRSRQRYVEKWTDELQKHYRRQEAAITSRIPKGQKVEISGIWWDTDRWNNELTVDLFKLNLLTAVEWANRIANELNSEVSEDAMMPYLEEHSRIQAEYINQFTRDNVATALREAEPVQAVKDVFSEAQSVWAVREAVTAVTAMSSFGFHEGARAGGLRSKVWHVNSSNPRESHAAINGETVGIRENFSNGMRWPGDPAGGADECANCQCSVEFS
jgi:HK97 family phage portal protein